MIRDLREVIEKKVELAMLDYGIFSTNSVAVSMLLTSEEIEKFKEMDWSEHWQFEIDGNTLIANYNSENLI